MSRHSIIVSLLVTTLSGCAALRRSPVPEAVDKCRQLSRQGVSAMELGKWYEAESLLRRASEAAPNDSDARRHLAEALWQRGETQGAIEQIEAARGLDPHDAATAVRAGEMHLALRQWNAAADCASTAVAADPNLADAWLLRARVAQRSGDTPAAVADMHHALQLAPHNTGVLAELATLHHASGDHQRCLITVHRWLDCYPPGEEPQAALLHEGQSYLALGRAREATESLQLACERGPSTAPLCVAQAQAALACGDAPSARRFAEQAVALDGGHAPAQQMMARLNGGPLQR